MSEIKERYLEQYIKTNCPNAEVIAFDSIKGNLKLCTVEELNNMEGDYFPLYYALDLENEKLVFGMRKGIIHTYRQGETGSGKTTRLLIPSIYALACLKDKPSFLIVDYDGQIIENLYYHFIENGYDVKIINCDDPTRSDTYNPLQEMVRECRETGELSYENMNKIRNIAELIQPILSVKDPIWEQGACAYTNGAILDKFEDLLKYELPERCMTLYNIIQNHYWMRDRLGSMCDLFKIPHYKKKGSNVLSVQKMISVTNNAERTRNSYFGVIENRYDSFGQTSLYKISSSSTINIREFIEKPTVIVLQPGTTSVGENLISLLMNDIYSTVVKLGKKYTNKMLPRKIHCFLDEFANTNIAKGQEFIKMLTTSRKYGMYWHMFLQCDAQLDMKFGHDIAKIIRANCTEFFMGSNDYETMQRFAKSCGQKTVETLESSIVKQVPDLTTVDLITAEELNLLEEGWVYVKSNRYPVMKTYFEAFYKCPEFKKVEDLDAIYPHNNFDYHQTEFNPDDIPNVVSSTELEVLSYIHFNEVDEEELCKELSNYNINKLVYRLKQKGMVEETSNGILCSRLSNLQYDLLLARLEKSPASIDELISLDEVEKDFPFEMGMDDDDDDIFFDAPRKRRLVAEFNPLIRVLKDHVESKRSKIKLEALLGVTSVPLFLSKALNHFYNNLNMQLDMENADCFPENPSVIKFEIVERYIERNDFASKSEWDKCIQEDIKKIKNSNAFPQSIIDIFEKAKEEITDNLTLGNIREIKKIISENG